MKLLSSCQHQMYVKDLKFGELRIEKILHFNKLNPTSK